jgi:hypothetical protein
VHCRVIVYRDIWHERTLSTASIGLKQTYDTTMKKEIRSLEQTRASEHTPEAVLMVPNWRSNTVKTREMDDDIGNTKSTT